MLSREDKNAFVPQKKAAIHGREFDSLSSKRFMHDSSLRSCPFFSCRDALRAGEFGPPSQRSCVGWIRKSNKSVTNLSLAISQELTVFAIAIKQQEPKH